MLKCKAVILPLAMSGLLAGSQLSWAESEAGGWYAGIGLGLSRLEPDSNGSLYEVEDKASQGYRLTLGYDWNERVGIEGYFSDLGEAAMSPRGEVGYRDLGVSGLYYLYRQQQTVQPGWQAFIKGGLGWMKNDTDLPYERVHDSQVMFGLGAAYAFSGGLSLRADLDLYDKDSQFLIFSLVQRFGAQSARPAEMTLAEPVEENRTD
ncbi:MAG: porin family protein [Candidatus Thiodiazotropha sp.]